MDAALMWTRSKSYPTPDYKPPPCSPTRPENEDMIKGRSIPGHASSVDAGKVRPPSPLRVRTFG